MQTFAQIITKIVDFFYRPFSKYIPQQLFRYAACGGGNMVLDWVLYFLIYNFVIGHELVYISLPFASNLSPICLTPHILTFLIVFPITLLTGFWLNRNVAFHSTNIGSGRQMIRYFATVLGSIAINYLSMKLLVEIVHIWPTPSKLITTVISTIYSYLLGRYYTFK